MTGGREVRLEGVVKNYGATQAVAGVDAVIAPGEFCTLLGPSGSGKTTMLKLIAGFESPSMGRVLIGGRDMADVPVAKRDIGMVFQNYALFPNMTVEENIAFPLEARGLPRSENGRRILDALAMVDMDGFAARYPRELSGGQQQRVALARALVFDPVILLMDEPLGALDKNLREAIQLELKLLHRRLGVTIVYVTHDQEEALFLSDRIIVLDRGLVAQAGAPQVLYRRPANRFVATFLGDCNLLPGSLRSGSGVVLEAGPVLLLAELPALPDGAAVVVATRPEHLLLATSPAHGSLDAIIREKIFLGNAWKFVLEVGKTRCFALLPDAPSSDALNPGNIVHVTIDAARSSVFPAA